MSKRYKIVKESDTDRLEKAVTDLLAEGWELQGGVSFVANEVGPWEYATYTYCQAMTLEAKPKGNVDQ